MQEVLDIYYLSVRPLVFSSTLSHIWDRLNLPMLLFKRRAKKDLLQARVKAINNILDQVDREIQRM